MRDQYGSWWPAQDVQAGGCQSEDRPNRVAALRGGTGRWRTLVSQALRRRTFCRHVVCCLLAFLVLLFFFPTGAFAQTTVSGSIAGSTTWDLAGSPYVLSGAVTVASNVTLTIQPGVVVKSQGGVLDVNGTLLAQGTSSAPIVFTSYADDSVGGDTNGDGNASGPAPWDWAGIRFESGSTGDKLDHVVVRYGGGLYGGGADCTGSGVSCSNIYIASSDVTLSNSVVSDGGWSLVQVNGASPQITGNVIERGPIGVYVVAGTPTITNNTLMGDQYGVNNSSGTTSVAAAYNYWGSATGPYDVTGNPGGAGARISGAVDYRPWLGADPNVAVGYALSGFVYDGGSHQPLPGVFVSLGVYGTYTDKFGHYTFQGLPIADATLAVSPKGYRGYTSPVNLASIPNQDVYLAPDFSQCRGGTLSGTVTDQTTGQALPKAPVSLDGATPVAADGSGQYSFGSLAPGEYQVSVAAGGYAAYHQTLTVCGNLSWNVPLTTASTVAGTSTPSGYTAEPVNTATGNYAYGHTDLTIPGQGLDFIFRRAYNSQAASATGAVMGPLGYGWTDNLHATLTVDGAGNVILHGGDAKTETFTATATGTFTPQYGVFATLTAEAGGGYALKARDLTVEHFGPFVGGVAPLLSIVDKNGNAITPHYTGANLTSVTDSAGRTLTFAYDGSGRVTSLTDPLGRSVQYGYDGAGNLATVTDPDGGVTTYAYDTRHELLTITDPNGHLVVSNTYDAAKRVVTAQTDAKGSLTSYVYDPVDNRTTVTDALGHVTVYHHDALLRLTEEDDPDGGVARYAYDARGNRTAVTDKDGHTTTYAYDANGNVTKKTDALGHVTTITYDADNDPLSRTDALGDTTTFQYDAKGNLIKTTDALGDTRTITYNAAGLPLTVTDARGNTTTNTYDARGNLTSVTDPLGHTTTYTYDAVGRRLSKTDANGHTTTTTYDGNDDVLTVTDPAGHVVRHTYDGNGNRLSTTDALGRVTRYAYDVKGLLTTTTDALGGTVRHTYDALDRPVTITDPDGDTTTSAYDAVGHRIRVIDALGHATRFLYDPQGNLIATIDPLGHTTTYRYDALNRRVRVTDPLGHVTATVYDALGRVASVTDAEGRATAYTYDKLGRLVRVTDANGGVTTSAYDANGNRIGQTDPDGNTTTYTYDADNRRISKRLALGDTTTYQYDAVGNLTRRTDADGHVTTYTYDALNRLTTLTYPDASSVTFRYDADGHRTQMVDPLGTTTYTYDALNRPTQVTDPFGQRVGYGYDAAGNRTTLTYPGNKAVAYSYDADDRLTGVTDWLGHTTTYAYDAAGGLTTGTEPDGSTATYGYDHAGELTSLTDAKADGTPIASYAYTLDPVGNPTQETRSQPLPAVYTPGTANYSYDAENRLTAIDGVANTYDANGNLTAKGSDTYAYDFENRLTQTTQDGVALSFRYDGLGNRYEQTVGGTTPVTTRYVLDTEGALSRVLAQTDTTNTIEAYYVYGHGLIERVAPDGTVHYYHYDPRGSTIALTDASGIITDEYVYGPYGKLQNHTGSTPNPFTFVGAAGVMSDAPDLYYLRARYYDPDLGRFLTQDPSSGKTRDPQTLNKYAYALDNPVLYIDISGLSAVEGTAAQVSGSSDPSAFHNALTTDNGGSGLEQALATFGTRAAKAATGLLFEKGLAWGLKAVMNAHGFSRLGEAASAYLKVLPIGSMAVVAATADWNELQSRGYSLGDVAGGFINIVPNVEYGFTHPRAGLNAVVEGTSSAVAVGVNILTYGVAGATGKGIQRGVQTGANWFVNQGLPAVENGYMNHVINPLGQAGGNLLYSAGHGNVIGQGLGF